MEEASAVLSALQLETSSSSCEMHISVIRADIPVEIKCEHTQRHTCRECSHFDCRRGNYCKAFAKICSRHHDASGCKGFDSKDAARMRLAEEFIAWRRSHINQSQPPNGMSAS